VDRVLDAGTDRDARGNARLGRPRHRRIHIVGKLGMRRWQCESIGRSEGLRSGLDAPP
jgi:hypothetical protein